MSPELTTPQRALHDLVRAGKVRMTWAPEIMEQRAPFFGHDIEPDRLRGVLLGLALGDALGNTTEGELPSQRGGRHGEIRDYLPNRFADGRRVGLPSDDTKLAFWMLEHLIERGGIEPEALARTFSSRRIFGIGGTVRAFIGAWQAGAPWHNAAQPSAGNGALMRIAAVLPPHARTGGPDLWVDAVLGTALTHNDRAAIGASVAFVGILGELLIMRRPPPPDWWTETYARFARPIEGDENRLEPRGGRFKGEWSGPLWRFVQQHVPSFVDASTLEAADTWYSGAYLLETVPTGLHILMRHAHDPEEAIVRAVNDTKDNDMLAAIVGAAVGALHGEAALPDRWKRGLLGRTGASDDGKVFELIETAVRRFGSP